MSNGDHEEIVEAPEGWRVAITAFDESDFTYGTIIPKSWFYEAFGIDEPKPQTSLKQAQADTLKHLASFENLKSYLLNERSMALRSVYGVGHEIVMPTEQTEWAETEMDREMKKAFARSSERLINIDHNQLTSQQTTENANALARLGAARALVLGRNRLPTTVLKQLAQEQQDNEDA